MNVWTVVGGYALMMFLVTLVVRSGKWRTKEGFLAANREVGTIQGAFSIAATWIWAPALFIAAQKSYEQGWVGLFWFTVPNVLCLVVFAFFAHRIRELVPRGFTISEYIGQRYSKRAQGAYIFQLSGLAACSLAVQLLAGGKVVSMLTGFPFAWTTLILAAIPLAYSMVSGLKASVATDYFQMGFIVIIGFIVTPIAIAKGGIVSFTGAEGAFTSLVSGKGAGVFWSFGLATFIGLMSGPFGDQSFWQRAFAIRADKVKRAFVLGAVVFATVPLMMGGMGFLARGTGFVPEAAGYVNLELVVSMFPTVVVLLFAWMLMSGLLSTVDSNLCAISSIAGHDAKDGRLGMLARSRLAMVGLCVAAILIANIPGMQVLYLFLFYGTLRASTMLPTVISLVWPHARLSEPGVFYGVILSIVVGLPVFAYGNFTNNVPFIVAGSLLALSVSGIVTALATVVHRARA